MGLIFICKRISLDGPPLHLFNCKSTQLLISVEISLFKQRIRLIMLGQVTSIGPEKRCLSLIFCSSQILFFFFSVIFCLLFQINSQGLYSIFLAFYCLSSMQIWLFGQSSSLIFLMGLDSCLCGSLVRLLIFQFFFFLLVFPSAESMQHLIIEALIARNLMESFFIFLFFGKF